MQDLRVGLRLLWKDRTFTVTAALTLAVCIGANTALFSVIDGVLLRPLPVPDSDRILLLSNSYPGAGAPDIGAAAVPDYFDRLRETDVFDELALLSAQNRSLDVNGTPAQVRVMQVTPSFFRLAQVPPALGRTFAEDEGEPGKERTVVLSHALWQSQFGADPQVLGRELRLDSRPYAIVGVMPSRFVLIEPDIQLWTPLAFTAEQRSDERRHSNNFRNIGRLKRGATIEQAQTQIDALNTANLKRFPQWREIVTNAGFTTIVRRLQDDLVKDVKASLYLLWGGAAFVLLVGGINVTTLVLVRTRARRQELATRVALGAGRWRIGRQLVTESLLLTALSALVGVGIGSVTFRLLGTLGIHELPRGSEVQFSAAAVWYALSIAATLGVALGIAPLAGDWTRDLTIVLGESGRTGTGGRGARAVRRTLVITQVAVAFMLLVGAGLLFASFRQVLAVDPGFEAEGVLTSSVALPGSRYADNAALRRFTDESLERIAALPGVSSAGATTAIPLGDSLNNNLILAEGYQMKPGESVIAPNSVVVSAGYFEAMEVELIRGRYFDRRDAPGSPRVVIVDDRLARRFWPGQDPIGRRLYRPDDLNDLLTITEKTEIFEVVGVIKEMKLQSLTAGDRAVGAYYFSMGQRPARGITYAIRTVGDPAALANAVRTVIQGIDRELPVFETQTMAERVERSLVSRRSPVLLSAAFGVVALFLSAIGLYGVLTHLVTQRAKEIGIRMALGSTAVAVVRMVLSEGVLLTVAGLGVGAAGATALTRALESQLFGVSPLDPLVALFAVATLGLVALAACALPARRAARIDPVAVLREG
jgi:predicted permease